jgi:hypothetical protein
MDLEDHSWSQGPSMMTKRRYHSCGIFKSAAHQGRNIVIAAGGYNLDSLELDSVEFLEIFYLIAGPKLPKKLRGATQSRW